MLFRPAILALLLASAANVAVLLAISPFAIEVLRHWDISSGSERQLRLERRTYLASTLMSLILATQLLALLLFVFNADRMSGMLVGAMCAVGTLNVNAYGFPALSAQVVVFFLAAVWLAIHHIDIQAPDYPLVRAKYGILLAMSPVLIAAFWLQLRYFLGIKADVITSCCSRLFSVGAKGLSGDVSAMAPLPAMGIFFGALLLSMCAAAYTARKRRGGMIVALTSAAAFAASIAGIVSFLSLYVYEHPHHHCPFCVLKAEYGYQGYWLYAPLFCATACGLATGAAQVCARASSLREIAPRISGRLAMLALAGFALFTAVSCLIILRSNLILIESGGAMSSSLRALFHLLPIMQGVKS
jgi:hypothetical protein